MVRLCLRVEEKTLSDRPAGETWRTHNLLQSANIDNTFVLAPWDDGAKSPQADAFRPWMSSELDASEHSLPPETDVMLGPPDQAEITEGNLLKENAEINRIEFEQQKRTSFEDGFERGTDLAKQQFDTTQQQFLQLIESISIAQGDMRAFYEPLKKLAVHLAEQLVRGELTLSSTAIERLIKETVVDLGHQSSDPIIINLSTQDRARLAAKFIEEFPQIDFRADEKISPGSLVLSCGDTAIEDFLEYRLHALADGIFKPQDLERPDMSVEQQSKPEQQDPDLSSQADYINTAHNDTVDGTAESQSDD